MEHLPPTLAPPTSRPSNDKRLTPFLRQNIKEPPTSGIVQLAARSGLSLTSALLIRGSNLLITLITARLLLPTEFGVISLLHGVQSTLVLFAGLNFGVISTSAIPALRLSDPTRAGRIIGLSYVCTTIGGGLIALVLLHRRHFLSELLFSGQISAYLIALLAINVLFISISAAQRGALYGLTAFRPLLLTDATLTIIAIPLTVLLTFSRRVSGYVESLTLIAFVTFLVNAFLISSLAKRDAIVISFRHSLKEWRILPMAGLPTFLSGIVLTPATLLVNIWLSHLPQGWLHVGIFSIADRWRTYLTFAATATSAPALATLSELDTRHAPRNSFQRVLTNYACAVAAATLLPSAAVVLVAPTLMRLYGTSYSQYSDVLKIAALTAVLNCLNLIGGQYLLATKQYWSRFAADAVMATCLIATSLYLLTPFGALGAILASALASLAAVLAVTVLILRHRSTSIRGQRLTNACD